MHHLAKQHNKTTSFIQARAYVDKIYKENVDRNNFFRDNINPIIANSIDQKASGLVMAYGQTNSGKTYTMTQESGVIHQAFNTIFQRKEEFDIKLQIFELRYSKSGGLIDDLFDPNVNQLRKPDRCTLKSLNENSWNQIKLAIDLRATNNTGKNTSSSRSFLFCLFHFFTLASQNHQFTIKFVDLAGSETVDITNPISIYDFYIYFIFNLIL